MYRAKKIGYLLRKDPKKIISALGRSGFFKWIPDKRYLQIMYYCETGRTLDLNNPKTFNEKLQWMKLYDRNPEYSVFVDKYAVRGYIKQTIGDEYLIPLVGFYDNVDEIPWGELPNKFVLKCTHGSSSNIICNDKQKLNIQRANSRLKQWMKKNWYWFGREWPYKNVKPRIICEEFLGGTSNTPDDYKVLCFNGKAKLIEVHMDRFGKNHTIDYYDTFWEKTDISWGGNRSNISRIKPLCFDNMIEFSEILAKDKYRVRIDWYEVDGKLYFGEITFFDGSGFAPFDNEKDDLMLGSWIELPQ